ncbi:MAG: hypothetical protein ACLSU0_08650, partial [Oscillospiraceae bacterium]
KFSVKIPACAAGIFFVRSPTQFGVKAGFLPLLCHFDRAERRCFAEGSLWETANWAIASEWRNLLSVVF